MAVATDSAGLMSLAARGLVDLTDPVACAEFDRIWAECEPISKKIMVVAYRHSIEPMAWYLDQLGDA